MAHREHQVPYDFFRYTSYGLRSLLSQAGFTQIKIDACGGFLTRWAYELPHILSVLPSAGVSRRKFNFIGLCFLPVKLVLLPIIRLMQLILLNLDRLDTKKNYPLGWSCEAIKPLIKG